MKFYDMKFIIYALTYPVIWILSRLPMFFLYIISDFFYAIIYYIVGYRKKVVFTNIKLAFPEKSDKEVTAIGKKFFRHFTDLVVESIKAFSISEKEIKKRYTYKNVEIINKFASEGRSIALTGSHQCNWEWSFGLPLFANINCYGAYTRIRNPYFEKVIKASRMRFGYDGVPTVEFKKAIDERVKNKVQSLYILLSDQSPELHKTKYWSRFLNHKLPVYVGAEELAKKYDFVVINMNVTKLKRGHYEADFQLLTENPNELPNYGVMDRFLKIVEPHIQKQPEYYLWSHKRFKHVHRYEEWFNFQQQKNKA